MSTELEVIPTVVDVTKDNEVVTSVDKSIELESNTVCVAPIENKDVVEGYVKEYSIVGDGLYASVSAESAPQWLVSLIDGVIGQSLATNNFSLEQARQSILDAINEIEIAKNQYQELINIDATIDGIITSRLATINATLSSNAASILELDTTKVTEDQAIAIAVDSVQASLNDGDIRSEINRIDTAISDTNEAFAASEEILTAQYDDISDAQSVLSNTVAANDTSAQARFSYDAAVTLNGITYNSGFGLATTITNPSYPTGYSEFWINAQKFRFSDSTGASLPVFSIDSTSREAIFSGKVTFKGGLVGTIDEAIAQSVETIAVGDKNINITDNVIPITSIVGDTNHAGYQLVNSISKSITAGVDSFPEPQLQLNAANSAVYSPFVDELFLPYYYRFAIKGVTNLNKFKITTVTNADAITYSTVTATLDVPMVSTEWYVVDGLINPAGSVGGVNGSIRNASGTRIGTINNFTLPSNADKLLLGWQGTCIISRMKLAKITADTITGSFASLDYVDAGYEDLSNTLEAQDGQIVTYYSNTVPASGSYGDYWVNTTSFPYPVSRYEDINKLSLGTLAWRLSTSATAQSLQTGYQASIAAAAAQGGADTAQISANEALGVANGKTTTYYQPAVPTVGIKRGDMWVDTGDNDKLYVAASDGSNQIAVGKWVVAQDAKGAKAEAISEANAYTDTALEDIDVQEDIDANNNAFAQSLGYANYSAMQAAASQGKTIIEGGFIRTDLIEVESLSAINSNLGDITAGSLNINNTFIVDSSGNSIIKSGGLVSDDFNGNVFGHIGTPTRGFRLSSNAEGTSSDPNIYGGYVKGTSIEAGKFYGSGYCVAPNGALGPPLVLESNGGDAVNNRSTFIVYSPVILGYNSVSPDVFNISVTTNPVSVYRVYGSTATFFNLSPTAALEVSVNGGPWNAILTKSSGSNTYFITNFIGNGADDHQFRIRLPHGNSGGNSTKAGVIQVSVSNLG